jgi:hypothetical protein
LANAGRWSISNGIPALVVQFYRMKRKKDLLAYTFTDRRYRVLLHLLFWVLVFASGYYFGTISFNAVRGTPATYLLAVKTTVVSALAFYTLMYGIVPWFGKKRSWVGGVLLFLLWLLLTACLDSLGDLLIFHKCAACGQRLAQASPDYYRFLQTDFPNILLVRIISGGFLYMLILQLSLPVAIKFARNAFRKTVQALQLSKDNLQLEFNFLKAQVNPHFLFNTLNNIYALVEADRKDQATATLARLSGFLRYTLYETGTEKIRLHKEVRLLQDYIELEQLRLNYTTVSFQFHADGEDYEVPPLLFMPALENAFKYTPDAPGNAIEVGIVAKAGMLEVTIQNPLAAHQQQGSGGIGLQNLHKRVQHYFGKRATCSAGRVNDVYLFRLSCPLQ